MTGLAVLPPSGKSNHTRHLLESKVVGHAPLAGDGESRSPPFQPPSKRSPIWHDLAYGAVCPCWARLTICRGGFPTEVHGLWNTGTQGHRDKHRQKHFPHMESLAICKTCLGAKLWVMHRLPVAANLAVHNFSPQAGVRIYGTTADMLEVFPYMATLTICGRGGRCVHTQRDRDTGTEGPLDKDRHRLTQRQTPTPTTTTNTLVTTKHKMNVFSTFKP